MHSRIISSVLFLLTLTFSSALGAPKAFAQSDQRTSIMALVGGALNQISDEGLGSGYRGKTTFGFSAGLTAQYKLATFFAIRSGLIYNQRKNAYTTPSNVTATTELNYTYLDVPAYLVLMAGQFSVFGGVSVGFKIGGTPEGGGLLNPSISDKSVITPIQFGVGYTMQNKFEIQMIRETTTLLTTIEQSTSPATPINNLNASAYLVRLGYIF